jgi:hypothetical protein
MFEDLSDNNFLLYAAKAYDKPHVFQSEFEDDLKKIKYLKRLFRKYRLTGDLKERLILNHIIVLSNVFGAEPATRILFFKTDEKEYAVLKTFLLFLGLMPERVKGINGKTIISSDIPVEMGVADVLRKL